MAKENLMEIVGWVGAAALLLSYFLVSLMNKSAKGKFIQLANIVGSFFLVLNTNYHKTYPPMVLNIIWMIVGIYALISSTTNFKLSMKISNSIRNFFNKVMHRMMIYEDLHHSTEEAQIHVDEMKKLVDSGADFQIFNHMYECLNVLDNKCQGLMTINSVIIAILSFGLKWEDLNLEVLIIYSVSFVMLIVSSILLLYLSFLKWVSTDDLRNYKQSMAELLLIRDLRTMRYRISVWLAVFAMILVTVGKMIDVFT